MENIPITEDLTNDEIISRTLAFLNKRRSGTNINTLLCKLENNRKSLIKDLMVTDGLIELVPNPKLIFGESSIVKISMKGIEVIAKNGDYLSFLTAHKYKASKETIIQNIKIWIPIAITIIGAVFLFLNYNKDKEVERKDGIIKTQSETIDLLLKKK